MEQRENVDVSRSIIIWMRFYGLINQIGFYYVRKKIRKFQKPFFYLDIYCIYTEFMEEKVSHKYSFLQMTSVSMTIYYSHFHLICMNTDKGQEVKSARLISKSTVFSM